MEKIVTITLNPAIDKSTHVAALVPEKKLRCTQPKFEPGGGGINVSRALKKLGCSSTAIYMAGGYSGKFFEMLIRQEGVESLVIPIKKHTRENLIVLEESSNLQYRFGMPGPAIEQDEWQKCLEILQSQEGYEYVVISGSNAEGVPSAFYSEAARIVKEHNARLVLDTSGEALQQALSYGVFLMKPNMGELSHLYGVPELDSTTVVEAARSFINRGSCEVVVVSMGPAGAMLITAGEKYHAAPPAVKIKSTVGAGDSMLAGILIALSRGWKWKNVLQYGVAAGTAATLNPGTELCKKQDVEKIYAFLD